MAEKARRWVFIGAIVACFLGVVGCAALDKYFTDDLIGASWEDPNAPGLPIRQHKILDAGDPVALVGDTVIFRAPHDFYVRYVDKNMDGDLDRGVEKLIRRTPQSDDLSAVWGRLDPDNPDHFWVLCPDNPHPSHVGCK